MFAHYWTGGVPVPRPVRDISLCGALIHAPEVYYCGTVIRIALEARRTGENQIEPESFAGIWARIARKTKDGFGVAFVFDRRSERKALQRFLAELRRKTDETDK
jgi:hypothetical protein